MSGETRYVHVDSGLLIGGGSYLELEFDHELGDWRAAREIGLTDQLEPARRSIGLFGWWEQIGPGLSDWEEQPEFSVVPITEDAFVAKWDEAEQLGVRVVDESGIPWGFFAFAAALVGLAFLAWVLIRLVAGSSDVVRIFVTSIVGYLVVDSVISYRRREASLGDIVGVAVLEFALIVFMFWFFELLG